MSNGKVVNYDLYVVTDASRMSHTDVAKAAYNGGADIVQLRVKDDNENFLKWAKEIASYSKSIGKTFIVNDSVEIALQSGADGVHIGQSDGSVKEIRKRTGKDFIIGVSITSIDEAIVAEKEGATYVSLSPIFDTSTKTDAGPGQGLKVLSEIVKHVSIPVIAIGGINLQNVADVIKSGASGVAVISAVVFQSDISKAATDMKKVIIQTKSQQS